MNNELIQRRIFLPETVELLEGVFDGLSSNPTWAPIVTALRTQEVEYEEKWTSLVTELRGLLQKYVDHIQTVPNNKRIEKAIQDSLAIAGVVPSL